MRVQISIILLGLFVIENSSKPIEITGDYDEETLENVEDAFWAILKDGKDNLPPCPVGDENYGSKSELIPGLSCKETEVEEICDPKKKSFIGAIVPYAHGVSGDIFSCGDNKVVFENFKYDGLGPDAFFWVGTEGDKPSSDGILLPYPFEGKFYDSEDLKAPILDKAFDGTQPDIVLPLPDNVKVPDLKWISIWCREYEVNFGDFILEDVTETDDDFDYKDVQCSSVASDGYTCVPSNLCEEFSSSLLDIRGLGKNGGSEDFGGLALCEDLSQACCHHTKILLPTVKSESEEKCDSKDKSFIGAIVPYAHGVSGDIYSCGDNKIVFKNFKYDGLAPDAFFWVGTKGDKTSSNGILLPYPFEGKFYDSMDSNAPILDKAFDGTQPDIVLPLPDDVKVSDLKWISVWCREYAVNFGDFILVDDQIAVETESEGGLRTESGNKPSISETPVTTGLRPESGNKPSISETPIIFETPVTTGNEFSTILLTEDNFEQLVKESKEMWLVVFVDPNCNNCGPDIKPEWDKAAIVLSGTAKMGKVFSKNLARRYNVDRLPSVVYFPEGEKNYYDIYTGDITSNNIIRWAQRLHKGNAGIAGVWTQKEVWTTEEVWIPEEVWTPEETWTLSTILLTEDNFKYELLQSNEMWLIAFIDPTLNGKDIKPIWDRASLELMNKVKFGKVFSKKLARKYGVKSYPTIKFFPAGDKSNEKNVENYDGEISTNSIVSWALKKYNGESDNEWLPNDRELFLAVNYDDLTSVEQALDNGGNPNFVHPKFGWTSIHHAAKKGYTEVIKALLSSNIADPYIKDKFGNSPLHYATKNGHEEIIEFISSLSQ